MDLPVAFLIWSQGPEKAIANAKLFYEKQNDWLMPSIDKADINDPSRKDDITECIAKLSNKLPPIVINRISQYLSPTDPQLYVKIFALKNGFTIEHLEQFLPHNVQNTNLAQLLMKDLPRIMSVTSEMRVVNYSPAFTFANSGNIIPDDQLDGKILTSDSADAMLKKAGLPVPLPSKRNTITKTEEHKPLKKHKTEHNVSAQLATDIAEDDEIQEAEEDTDEGDDIDTDDDVDMDIMSERLKAILD